MQEVTCPSLPLPLRRLDVRDKIISKCLHKQDLQADDGQGMMQMSTPPSQTLSSRRVAAGARPPEKGGQVRAMVRALQDRRARRLLICPTIGKTQVIVQAARTTEGTSRWTGP